VNAKLRDPRSFGADELGQSSTGQIRVEPNVWYAEFAKAGPDRHGETSD